MIKTLDQLLENAKGLDKKMVLAVAAAQEEDVLESVSEAYSNGIIVPILIGDKSQIESISEKIDFSLEGIEIIDCSDLKESALTAVKLVNEGRADFLMKGLIDTAILLKAVLDKEHGLKTGSLLSHVMVYEMPTYHKLLLLTDGGMNIEPGLEEKASIAKNAASVSRALGNKVTKIAAIAAKEKVNEKMIATVDADKLQTMCSNGEFGDDVILEGPLALDLALSAEAAQIKKFSSRISGDTDVLLVPSIEVGNGIGKALSYLADAKSAGIIMGARVPVVLTSRADSKEAKLYSIALGSCIAQNLGGN